MIQKNVKISPDHIKASKKYKKLFLKGGQMKLRNKITGIMLKIEINNFLKT